MCDGGAEPITLILLKQPDLLVKDEVPNGGLGRIAGANPNPPTTVGTLPDAPTTWVEVQTERYFLNKEAFISRPLSRPWQRRRWLRPPWRRCPSIARGSGTGLYPVHRCSCYDPRVLYLVRCPCFPHLSRESCIFRYPSYSIGIQNRKIKKNGPQRRGQGGEKKWRRRRRR